MFPPGGLESHRVEFLLSIAGAVSPILTERPSVYSLVLRKTQATLVILVQRKIGFPPFKLD